MFIILPLILIAGSLAGMVYIVRPKLQDLKNMQEPADAEKSFWRAMLPEFFGVWDKVDFKAMKQRAIVEYEKLLRRMKILSLKSDNLINKLLEKRPKVEKRAEFKEITLEEKDSMAQFKNKENQLISEISKNPKDKILYKELAELYLDNKIFQDAKESFNVVLELDPNDKEAKEALEKIGKMG